MRLNNPIFLFALKGFILSVLSGFAYSVQPMTESDLEIVSATTGDNILNIFGASEAGLRVDSNKQVEPGSATLNPENSTPLNKEQFQEGENAASIAASEIRELEQNSRQTKTIIPSSIIGQDVQQAAMLSGESTSKASSAYSTESEINYKTANFKHQMRELDNGGVAVTRDLQIDLLKLENLKGAHFDESRSAGSIYLSDWRSQGDTRIVTD